MNRDDFVNALSWETGLTKRTSENVLNAVFRIISDALVSGERVQIVDFGTFEVKDRAPRMGRNPRKNLPIPIPAKRVPSFKPGKALKDAVESSVS